jgi:hypothetical protein
MAYDDGGLKIRDYPMEEARVHWHSIQDRESAERILAWAKTERPDIVWVIIGNGPFGVHEKR